MEKINFLIDSVEFYINFKVTPLFLDNDVTGRTAYTNPLNSTQPDKQIWIAIENKEGGYYLKSKITNQYLCVNTSKKLAMSDVLADYCLWSVHFDSENFATIRHMTSGNYLNIPAPVPGITNAVYLSKIDDMNNTNNDFHKWQFNFASLVLQNITIKSLKLSNLNTPNADNMVISQGQLYNQTYAEMEQEVSLSQGYEETTSFTFKEGYIGKAGFNASIEVGVLLQESLEYGKIKHAASLKLEVGGEWIWSGSEENTVTSTSIVNYDFKSRIKIPAFSCINYSGHIIFCNNVNADFEMITQLSAKIDSISLTGKEIKNYLKCRGNIENIEIFDQDVQEYSITFKEKGTFKGAFGINHYLETKSIDVSERLCNIYSPEYVLCVLNNSTTPKSKVVGYDSSTKGSEPWPVSYNWIIKREDGYFRIQNANSGLFLFMDTNGSIGVDTHNVNDSRQLWIIPENENGYIYNGNQFYEDNAIAVVSNNGLGEKQFEIVGSNKREQSEPLVLKVDYGQF